MECKCNDCGVGYYNRCEYRTSICDKCLLEYNGVEFDVICNKCKKIIKTVKHNFTVNNFVDVYRKAISKKDYCKSCYM